LQREKMLDMIHHKKFPFTEIQGNYHVHRSLSGIPVMNQTHPIQTSHLIFLMWTFVLSSNKYAAV